MHRYNKLLGRIIYLTRCLKFYRLNYPVSMSIYDLATSLFVHYTSVLANVHLFIILLS